TNNLAGHRHAGAIGPATVHPEAFAAILGKLLTIVVHKIVFEEAAELPPLRPARNAPIRTENKSGYFAKVEILAEHLVEIGRLLVQCRARPDHRERLIAQHADEFGWILAGPSRTRCQQHDKGYRGDPCNL